MKKLFILIFVIFNLSIAEAAIEAYDFKDETAEADYKVLIQELRCLVCQNQNLADSNADLAKDLRQQTYEMVQQGKNRDQIADYMVDRYGDFVLYRPPFKSSTLLLWAGPFALLVMVIIVVLYRIKNTRQVEAPEKETLTQAKQLLSNENDNNLGDGK